MEGIVVSNSSDKTAIVAVSSRSFTKYKGKTRKKRTRYFVHDPQNETKVGNSVQITQSRPLSNRKRWRLFKIVSDDANILNSDKNLMEEDNNDSASN